MMQSSGQVSSLKVRSQFKEKWFVSPQKKDSPRD
jgi:hypothetical protein